MCQLEELELVAVIRPPFNHYHIPVVYRFPPNFNANSAIVLTPSRSNASRLFVSTVCGPASLIDDAEVLRSLKFDISKFFHRSLHIRTPIRVICREQLVAGQLAPGEFPEYLRYGISLDQRPRIDNPVEPPDECYFRLADMHSKEYKHCAARRPRQRRVHLLGRQHGPSLDIISVSYHLKILFVRLSQCKHNYIIVTMTIFAAKFASE